MLRGSPLLRLRTHLVVLVCLTLVPVLGFAALVVRENARLQLAVTERGLRETTRAVARTVDKELETASTTLEALGESEDLDRGDLDAFRALCRRVVSSQEWISIRLFEPDGRPLMQTSAAPGAPLVASQRPELIVRARDTRQPVVSDLIEGVVTTWIVAVYVPILRAGEVRFVLAAGLPASDFSEVLRAQQFGPGSIAILQDRQGAIIARTQGEPEVVGRRVANLSPGQEGWVRSRVREGTEVYLAFATAPLSGWRVVITLPVDAVMSPIRRGLWQVLAGAALAAALAAAMAFAVGRRIARAVGALLPIARAVERGDPAEPLRTGVAEVNAVAVRLRAAADLARAREQQMAQRERQARAMADVAHALNASPDLDSVLRTAMEAVRALARADSARIALVDDDGRLVLRHSTEVETAMPPGFAVERGQGIGGRAWDTGQPVRADDFAADPRFARDPYLSIARADGIVSCMAVPIVAAGAVVGVIYANNFTLRPFSVSDETQLVILAEHVAVAVQKTRLLARELAARALAEAANRGKDELLAMLGHELRNPLSAIANAVRVLALTDAPSEPARRAREVVARQNAHLARIVDDLLDVARVTSGKIALVRRPLELSEVVRAGVATLSATGRTGDHRLAVDVEPVWVDGDETRLEQVVNNLVGNALRFTPPGGDVQVTLRQAGGEAVLGVRDSGIGIDAEMLPRIFDLFVQGARPADRPAGGLGLGLTLVRRIAELHGGSAEAASDGAGRGSAFTVRLPALAAPPPAAPASSAADEGGGRRILIVEDNEDSREMLRRLLELAGHQVHEAVDGPSGLSAALDVSPEVAVVDIGLPGFDGYEMARRLRAAAGTAIHLVALTGYGQPDDRRQALDAGFDAHLVKPVDPDALLTAIHPPAQSEDRAR